MELSLIKADTIRLTLNTPIDFAFSPRLSKHSDAQKFPVKFSRS